MNYCPDCNKVIHKSSKRCRKCALLNSWNNGTRKRSAGPKCNNCGKSNSDYRYKLCRACRLDEIITKCIDCNKRIYKESTRCQSCATKHMWKNNQKFIKAARSSRFKSPGNTSRLETKYLEAISTYGFQPQGCIKNFKVDYLNPLDKIIIEFFGDYWHCNPDIYSADFFHPDIKLTAQEIWTKDRVRIKKLKNLGYTVYILWEKDVSSESFSIHNFLESLNIYSNVLPEYKSLTTQEIVDKLEQNKFPYAVAMEHWKGDFNLATVCRNANALGAKEVFYVGKKRWDKRGAVGVQYYTNVHYIRSYKEFEKLKAKYTFVGVDNIPGAKSIFEFSWPDNPLMIFGEENSGLTRRMIDVCENIIYIPMHGCTRSFNAGCASGITMSEFVRQFNETSRKRG